MRKTILVTKSEGGFGPHLTLDLSGCALEPLVDYERLYDLLNNLPGHIGMTKMTLPYVVKWLDHGAQVPGYSGFVMIAESHISFHTFPEKNFVFIDFFSCKQFDVDKAVDYLVRFFQPQQIEKNLVMRGKHFEKNGEHLF
jgi:S-adenosylmethionine decarboxylase